MKRGSLGLGLALCALGAVFALAPGASTALAWLARWWPVAPVLLGMGSLVGFATRRVPRSPWRGAALIVVGALALAVTLTSSANPLALYGRFWPIVLGVVALVEVLRFYTYAPETGERRPVLFSRAKVVLVGLIVMSGLAAHRVAEADPNVLARIAMPAGLDHLRDELFGEPFQFAALTGSAALPAAGVVDVTNRFGDVVIDVSDDDRVEASLVPTVRAYDRAAAERVASALRLEVASAGTVVRVGTNRDDIDHEIGTDLHLVVPRTASVRIVQAHGKVTVVGLSPTSGLLSIDASHAPISLTGVHATVQIKNANDAVQVTDSSGSLDAVGRTDVVVRGYDGRIRLEDSDSVKLARVTGPAIELVSVDHASVSIDGATGDAGAPTAVSIQGEHTSVTLKDVVGDARIRTTHESITADGISGLLDVDSTHARVEATRVGSLRVATDHDDVRAKSVAGTVDITNDHGGVVVSDFDGECSVRTSFDAVRLVASAKQAGRVTVENEHGRIDAALPSSGTYRVAPKVERGSVRLDPAFARTDVSSGGWEVTLSTSFDDIVVRALGATDGDRKPA